MRRTACPFTGMAWSCGHGLHGKTRTHLAPHLWQLATPPCTLHLLHATNIKPVSANDRPYFGANHLILPTIDANTPPTLRALNTP
jgi:hypothetical protein